MKRFIPVTIDISLNDILNSLGGVRSSSIVEIIKAIDQDQQDWDFTKQCFDYFNEVMKDYEKENQ